MPITPMKVAATKSAGASKGVGLGLGLGLGIYGPILLVSVLGAGGYYGYKYWQENKDKIDKDRKGGDKKRPAPTLTPSVKASVPTTKVESKDSKKPAAVATPAAKASPAKGGKGEESTDTKIQNALKSAASKNFTLKLDDKKSPLAKKAAVKPNQRPANVAKGKQASSTKTGNRKK
jgi:hypothetical protein